MAISKNFVVKNGLEVAIDSLVVDTDTKRVGIASTTPNTTLDVRGGIGATHLEVTGIATIATLSVTGFTATNGDFTNLTGTIGTITSLESTNGSITNLSGTIGTFSSTLNSYLVIATELSNTNGTITNLSGTISTITNMSGTIGTITNLVGTSGTITNLTGTIGTVTNLVSTSSTITNLTGTSATITNLTFTEGSGTNLNVTGITTLATADIVSLTITGAAVTDLSVTNNFDVAGLSTFTGTIDANGDLDVDGRAELDITNISETLNVVGISTFGSDVDINANVDISGYLDVDGHTELDDLNVSGVSTFASAVDINASIDVDGHTELDDLNVSGISTFVGAIDANGSLDVDGHTELDDVNVSGTATITSLDVQSNFDVYDSQATFHNNVLINGNLTIGGTTATVYVDDLRVTDKDLILGFTTDTSNNEISTDDTANHGGIAIASTEGNPLVNFTLTGINTFPDTYKQIMWVKADSYGFGTTDAWLFNYGVGIGSTLVPNGVRLAVSEIQFTDDTIDTPNITITEDASISRNFSVTGLSTFTGNIDADGDLDVDGRTELDITNIAETLNVVGISTFASDVDINAGLDVDGHTELDDVNVSGFSTFASNVDINSDLDVDGHTELDNVNVSGFSTFVGFSTFNDYVYVQDGLNVSGVVTATQYTINGTTVINSSRELQNIASLDATTTATIESAIANAPNTFTDLRVSGLSTFVGVGTFQSDLYVAGNLNVTGDLVYDEVTGRNINITGIATIGTTLDVNGDIDVDGHTELDNLNVSGVSTFTGTADFNGDIDVDGHTELDNINISGFSTFVGFATFSDYVYIQDGLNVTGTGVTLTTLNVTGVSTLGGQSRLLGDLYVSGISTFQGNVNLGDNDVLNIGDDSDLRLYHDGSNSYIDDNGTGNLYIRGGNGNVYIKQNTTEDGIIVNQNGSVQLYYDNAIKFETISTGATVTGDMYATAYYGDGSNLSGVIGGVGIATAGGTVGFGATILDFRGAGISTITISSGIGTINIEGGGSGTGSEILKESFTVGAGGQSVFTLASSYTSGYIDVYLNGVKLSSADFTESASDEITLVSAAVEDDVVDFVNYRTISLTNYAPTAGIATYASTAGIATYADTAGISTTSEGLTGTPNISVNDINSVGVITATAFVDDGTDLLTEINTKASTGKAIAMAMVFG